MYQSCQRLSAREGEGEAFCRALPRRAPSTWLQYLPQVGHREPCANPRYWLVPGMWSACRLLVGGHMGWPHRQQGSPGV
jgi:hypothetical protein